ncbi:MAG: helix-turn-helix domain-containing protein [Desulfobacter sp.]|nr:MAG: helix-turn-helix domain-containing protein [Desulfobacter sp.]
MKQVIFLLFPGVEILDFAGPLQTFMEARNRGCDLTVDCCSWQTEIRSSHSVFINRLDHFSGIRPQQGDILVIPGFPYHQYAGNGMEKVPDEVFHWLRRAYNKGAELCSVCTGAFALAHAGLLDEKSCTTHWQRTRALQRDFPRLNVRTDCLFVHDAGIYTSAGIASGIDLALALVEKHWGPHVTCRVARDLVVYLRRDGGHHQQSIYLSFRDHIQPVVHRIQDWLISNPGKTYTIDSLARRFGLSPRNLTRTFKKATGITIKAYATLLVLEHARTLLQDPGQSVEAVAVQCGFHDGRQLRRLWKKHFGTTPGEARHGACLV